jgi:hypothetical protein
MRDQSFSLPPHPKNLFYSQTIPPIEIFFFEYGLSIVQILVTQNLFFVVVCPFKINLGLVSFEFGLDYVKVADLGRVFRFISI